MFIEKYFKTLVLVSLVKFIICISLSQKLFFQIAQEASAKAEVVSKKSSESKAMASELSSAAKSLTVKLSDTKDRLTQKEQVADTDSESALLVLKIIFFTLSNIWKFQDKFHNILLFSVF